MRNEKNSGQIDTFYWRKLEDSLAHSSEQVIFFDAAGTRHETQIASEKLNLALSTFSQSYKSIQRSTGGRVNAELVQLVLFNSNAKQRTEPEVRIRVRFWDFEFGPGLKLLSPEPTAYTKIVTMDELAEPLTLPTKEGDRQTCGIHLGRALLPIFIIDEDENDLAYFVEWKAWHKSTKPQTNSSTQVMVYQVPKSAVRFLSTEATKNQISEWEQALLHYRQMGLGPEAELLSLPKAISVPGGLGPRGFRDYLRARIPSYKEPFRLVG